MDSIFWFWFVRKLDTYFGQSALIKKNMHTTLPTRRKAPIMMVDYLRYLPALYHMARPLDILAYVSVSRVPWKKSRSRFHEPTYSLNTK